MPTSISDSSPPGRALCDAIRAEARALGFDAVGFASAAPASADGAALTAYLADGRHGDMAWMAQRVAQRASAQGLWPAARSIIALGMNYGPADDPLAGLSAPDRGVISVYARGRDYHTIVKKRLKRLARWLVAEHGGEVKVFVDTAPVMEKPLAARAGIGWQGRHTNLVSREFGSWLFLGEVYTTLELVPDLPAPDRCGRCTRCIDICPTQAITAPGELDPRRCISYLTIEHKGHIAAEYRAAMANRIYGCDDCLAVCPWNKFAEAAREAGFEAREGTVLPPLAELVALDDAAFRARYPGSAIKRLGRDRFVRNVLIAIGNSGDAVFADAVEARLGDGSPLVRAMAVWALGHIAPARAAALCAAQATEEKDDAVLAEWQALGA